MSNQEINYAETTTDIIIRLLKAWQRGNYFKDFFYGDPGEIPSDHQPCIIVDLQDTKVIQGPTGKDEVEETIDVALVLNKKDYMDDFDDTTVADKKMLELLVQGKDPITQRYDQTTVLGILRQNFTMGNYALNQEMNIKYRDVPRNGMDEDPTREAHIFITITRFEETPSKV